ncbi:MAG: hypothetical protein GAK32_00539 [Pseudomonas fluorescens]|nr:MAG: hypothetical protein GAK32_00539 [Pseudomonas fluorescens]
MPQPTAPQPLPSDLLPAYAPLIARQEWSFLRNLDALRTTFDGFLGTLNVEEQLDYVRLQKAWIDAQHTLEKSVGHLTQAFEQQALESLREGLKTLTGQDIDPAVARIHTRYLQSSRRARRALDEHARGGEIRVSSMTLWAAACLNYDGPTGWSYPGRTGLADASYLDSDVKATAADFIALVRRLDIGGQLKRRLDQALLPNAPLGAGIMALATAEFEFALVEALKNSSTSGVDREKYQWVKRALMGDARWNAVEEMHLFIPHGVDTISWIPQSLGFTGQYVGAPPGDSLRIAHLVFSVSGCRGAFSFFANRPGGALRHHASHRIACEEFHVAFQGFYRRGQVDWLYQNMVLRDCARLKQIVQVAPAPRNLEWVAKLLYRLAQSIPKIDKVSKIGYVRNQVQKAPVVVLNDFYIHRCRANLQELANETPGFMPTMIELFQAVISEILNVLLIPVPGALKGLGRVRAFGMFVVLGQALVEGGHQAMQGEPGDLLQGFIDIADLLISSRLHTRLARSVLRRHQRLYQQLSQPRSAEPDHQQQATPQVLEKMLGAADASVRDMERVLDTRATSRAVLDEVWRGAVPSASLLEAAHRFQTDALINWVVQGADPGRPVPVGAVDVLAPLLTQLDAWPASASLSIQGHQGQEICRYSKHLAGPTTEVVRVSVLENYQFAYAPGRRITAHLPKAIVELLPQAFAGGERALVQQLALRASALKIDLLEALTMFSQASRSRASGARASVRVLLPDRTSSDQPVPAVITRLQALHPEVSMPRLLEVLREHPLSAQQQTQLLEAQLQPEALYLALRAARQVARREAIVDGLFRARRFNRQTQNWAAQFSPDAVHEMTGRALVVSPAGQTVPYVSKGATDRTMVVIDQRQGRFSTYDPYTALAGPMVSGADGFYDAIVSQLSGDDLQRIGFDTRPQAVAELRYQVARALLRHRAPDGSFFPPGREIAQYASNPSSVDPQPDALGVYNQGTDRYVFIEGTYFKVEQAWPLAPWRIRHPSLSDAYAPVLTHNGAGAWRHEWESPLTWDGQQPFYRLGPSVRSLTPDAIEQVQRISGLTPEVLRRVHVRNERPPAVLLDTLERLAVHQRVKEGVETGADFFDQLLGEVGTDRADALVGRSGVERIDQVTVLEAKVALDKPRMEHLFFEALSPEQHNSPDPLAQVLQRDYPGLTNRVAEDLAGSNLTPAERRSLERGVVPLTLAQAARWWVAYLRKTRLLESVHLPATANESSSTAILHALAQIDGWPPHLRVELWKGGVICTSIGPFEGSLQRIVEIVSNQYQAYIPLAGGRRAAGSPGPFLEVLLAALPPAERAALGYSQGAEEGVLLAEVRSRLERNWEFAETLGSIGRRPYFNPPRRVAQGLIGYPLSGRGLRPVERAQVARLRVLYPSMTDEEVLKLWNDAGDSVRARDAMIDYLYQERDTMNAALGQWLQTVPDGPLRNARTLAVECIQRCWAKEASAHGTAMIKELNLDGLDLTDLPTLGAHFGHVEVLSLKNNQLSGLPGRFLRCFPGVTRIYLSHNRFEQMPSGLSGVPHLMALYLSNNQLKFRLGDVVHLSELTELRVLDLSSNPLRQGQRLDLYQLKHLRYLNLRNTELEHLPKGAVTLRMLEVFDLRDNRIKVLTRSDLFLFTDVHRAMDLSGNPLSEGTLQMFRQYREGPGRADVYFGLRTHRPHPIDTPDRWLAALAVSEVPSHLGLWQDLQARDIFGHFFNLLACISADLKFTEVGYRALRQDLTRRVWRLIDGATNHEDLATIMFTHRYEMNRGVNGWMVSLNDLELKFNLFELHLGSGRDAMPFLNCLRAVSRLAAITNTILLLEPDQTPELAGTRILAYRIALSQTLNLPLGFDQRLDRTLGIPRPESVAAMRNRIISGEALLNWPELLLQEAFWRQFLQRKYEVRLQAALGQYDQALELALDRVNNGELNEGTYLAQANDISRRRQVGEYSLLRVLTQGEWANFNGAADASYSYQ